jgi:hypothetical protein
MGENRRKWAKIADNSDHTCNIDPSGDYSCLTVDMTFKRQLSYYIITIYIPTFMIVMVSWMSFWLDHKSVGTLSADLHIAFECFYMDEILLLLLYIYLFIAFEYFYTDEIFSIYICWRSNAFDEISTQHFHVSKNYSLSKCADKTLPNFDLKSYRLQSFRDIFYLIK